MLRERTSGTLERLLTTPLGRLDMLLGYGLAFGLAAALQAVVTVTVATTVYDPSKLIGVVMARYVLRLEPLASASHESLIASLGPTLQRNLTGDPELLR